MKKDSTGRISVRGIIEHEGKLLLVSNKDSVGFWHLPGGRVEQGESLEMTLDREIIEELGVKPVVGKPLVIHQLISGDYNWPPGVYFHIINGEDFVDFDVSKTSHGVKELSRAAFVDLANETVLPNLIKEKLPYWIENDFNTPCEYLLEDEISNNRATFQ